MPISSDWFLKNIGSATWWRSLALGQGVTDEGGVDVPIPGGDHQPIYALADGQLMGNGYFYHGGPYFSTQKTGASGNPPGWGVLTENVPGVGQVYYQHITLAPGIPFCQNGNCGGYVVHKGDLIGYSNCPNPCEVEVGINSTWGGIWGTNTNPSLWSSDPRGALTALARSGGVPVTGGTQTATTGASIGNPLDAVTQWLQSFFAPFATTFSWLTNPIRIIKLIIGIALVAVSLLMFLAPEGEKLGRTALRAGMQAAEVA